MSVARTRLPTVYVPSSLAFAVPYTVSRYSRPWVRTRVLPTFCGTVLPGQHTGFCAELRLNMTCAGLSRHSALLHLHGDHTAAPVILRAQSRGLQTAVGTDRHGDDTCRLIREGFVLQTFMDLLHHQLPDLGRRVAAGSDLLVALGVADPHGSGVIRRIAPKIDIRIGWYRSYRRWSYRRS